MTDMSSDTASTLISTATTPISRRTVLAGSAFAIPAVMLTASTPAFAASGLSLSFNKSSYSGQGCSSISGARVSAADGGTPRSGVSVTVSLAGGYTFASGGTSFTGVTGSDGSLALPPINVPVQGGTGTATGSATGASSVSVSLNGTAATNVYFKNNVETTAVGVPASATPIQATAFLTSDGRYINGFDGTVVGSNIDKLGLRKDYQGSTFIPAIKKDGSAVYFKDNVETAAVGIPSGSSPYTGTAFLTSDGRYMNGFDGTVVGTNIDLFGQLVVFQGDEYIPARKKSGLSVYFKNNVETAAVGIPSGATPVQATAFLTSDGRYMNGFDGSVIATNIDALGQRKEYQGSNFISAITKGGSAVYFKNNVETAAVGIPSGATPIQGTAFLASDGRYMNGFDGTVIATNIDSFGQLVTFQGDEYIPAKKRSSC